MAKKAVMKKAKPTGQEWLHVQKVRSIPKVQQPGHLSKQTQAILDRLKKCKPGETLAFDYGNARLAKNRAESLQKLARKPGSIVKRAIRRSEQAAGRTVYRMYVTRS